MNTINKGDKSGFNEYRVQHTVQESDEEELEGSPKVNRAMVDIQV